MPHQIAIPQIVDAAMKGIATAQKDFENWSHGWWLGHAPEYLSTVYVARELARQNIINLEQNAKRALKDAGAIARGPMHNHIRASGRFDILLFWANETPRAPIEVKGWVKQYQTIAADMRRMEAVIHRAKNKSTFQFALMVFFTSVSSDRTFTAKEKLTKWISNIETAARNALPARTTIKLHSRRISVEGDSAWTAVSILLKPKNG